MRRGAALIFVTALLAGFWGGDKAPSKPSEARRGYERAVRGVVAQAREAGARPAALRAAADRLRGIRPPREVARPHRDLAAGFAAVAEAREAGRRCRTPSSTASSPPAARSRCAATTSGSTARCADR